MDEWYTALRVRRSIQHQNRSVSAFTLQLAICSVSQQLVERLIIHYSEHIPAASS